MYRYASVIVLTCVLAVGCADSVPTAPSGFPGDGSAPAMPAAMSDLSGVYDFSETTEIKATPLAASFFGLVPEGPVTHISCASSGELTVVQNGADVTGVATQSSLCETKGGVVFDPFPLFPHGWEMAGTVTGRSIEFTVGVGLFPCHYRGSVRASGGIADEIRATGACDLPKEAGNDKILGFVATRQ